MPDSGDSVQRRVLGLVAAAALAVALIGVAVGTAPGKYQAERPPIRVAPDRGDVPPARTHAELERHPWGGGAEASGWNAGRAAARERATAEAGPSSDSIAAAVDDRAQRRAFDGAPPVVPHPVRAGGAAECLACHQDGFVLGTRRASAIPHAAFASCTQCHVESVPALRVAAGEGPDVAESRWVGLASPTAGEIAYTGAPPAVPHPTWMRERCESCHGPEGRAALRTPHPDRRSCLQCHPAISEHGTLGSR